MVERKARVIKHRRRYALRRLNLKLNFDYTKYGFNKRELIDIGIAWLALSIAFAYALYIDFSGSQLLHILGGLSFVYIFIGSMIAIACGFIMHELMHKFDAQKYGYEAHFRMWIFGLLLALITSLFGFVYAAPGATYFEPDPSEMYTDPNGFRRRYGTISFAGPRINLIFGFIFLGLFYLALFLAISLNLTAAAAYPILVILAMPAFINFYLCAFNLIPIMPLDGAKVFRWDKKIWATFFVISVAVSLMIFLGKLPYFPL
ncbi:hypothetical protein IHE50_00825 [Candidatus Parvarchaeota archaeon]|uniref:Peptidase M50 n=1 Tax=Candidatus Acidifodinimicrobium mancum TaxID=2898728 RepID=A0A8T3UYR2_9ARCH|nr:hypothetical protein [Candidatus Acidifodinimicrobium mancum]